jgi:hypothetical protein
MRSVPAAIARAYPIHVNAARRPTQRAHAALTAQHRGGMLLVRWLRDQDGYGNQREAAIAALGSSNQVRMRAPPTPIATLCSGSQRQAAARKVSI